MRAVASSFGERWKCFYEGKGSASWTTGVWIEICTVVIPGLNDSDEELTQCADFIASVHPDIPWHISRFHPDWKMRNVDWTPPETMLRAVEIGRAAGLMR